MRPDGRMCGGLRRLCGLSGGHCGNSLNSSQSRPCHGVFHTSAVVAAKEKHYPLAILVEVVNSHKDPFWSEFVVFAQVYIDHCVFQSGRIAAPDTLLFSVRSDTLDTRFNLCECIASDI